MKSCPHADCGGKDPASASYSECHICGRIVCLGNGCFCSENQATNPIRRGVGRPVYVKTGKRWEKTYPYATAEAKANPVRARYIGLAVF